MKYLILGAGPAGLAAAARLKQKGETSFLVLERESQAGGLCRSVMVDGAPFDIGGGHFLDTKRPQITKFIFEFMPEEEWDIFERDSQIKLKDVFVHHPLEANIWELPEFMQEKYLNSISEAGSRLNLPKPEKFVQWIRWKFGDRIADDYMLPYNSKMFSNELDELGTYWLEKLPDVSYEETLEGCRKRKAYGKQPAHARFYYPRCHGYGEVWKRMAHNIRDHIIYGSNVISIDFQGRTVKTEDGRAYTADIIINTTPWKGLRELAGMPKGLSGKVSQLKHSSIETRYFPDNFDTNAQWVYFPDASLPYHRILVRPNFCAGSRGYWTETRKERIQMFRPGEGTGDRFMNEYAYPINTVGKQEIMGELLAWCRERQVYGLGRWGEHQHYNSDVVVELALKLVDNLCRFQVG